MIKFEYSDFYKFITSIGIALIILSVLLPWLYLREDFDLVLKEAEINQLTQVAQDIIYGRQSIIQGLISFIPIASLVLFITGLVITVFGGYKWWSKTQTVLDELNELNKEIQKRKLDELTPTELDEKRAEDARAELVEDTDFTIKNIVESALRAEEEIAGLMQKCLYPRYEVLRNRRLGSVYFDIVLLANNPGDKDFIIEIKYIRKGFKYGWLRDNAMKQIYSNQIYENETGRSSIPILYVIGAVDVLSGIATQEYRARINQEVARLDSQIIFVFRDEDKVASDDCGEMYRTINYGNKQK